MFRIAKYESLSGPIRIVLVINRVTVELVSIEEDLNPVEVIWKPESNKFNIASEIGNPVHWNFRNPLGKAKSRLNLNPT